jgi:hypothetical protein
MGRLQQASNKAVDTLIGIMEDPSASAGGRVQASKCVLEQFRKSLEMDGLNRRVSELESWRRGNQDERELQIA